MKVLIIYDEIPEETTRAVVEMTDEEYTYFSQAHNVIANSGAAEHLEDIVFVISSALSDRECTIHETGKHREYSKKWFSNINKTNTDLSEVDHLIHCGFYL